MCASSGARHIRSSVAGELAHLHAPPLCGVYGVCAHGFVPAVWESLVWRDDRSVLCAGSTHVETNSLSLGMFIGIAVVWLYLRQAGLFTRMRAHL